MAEPYDTINAIGSGPNVWYRFSAASGGVSNEGSATGADLSETSAGSLGTFNWTYQYEVNPAGDGYGMRANGAGGLDSTGSTISPAPSNNLGTMFFMYRTDGAVPNSNAYYSFCGYNGFDSEMTRIGINQNGSFRYWHQITTADEYWTYLAQSQLVDDAVHSLAVTNATGSSATPQLYMDGVNITSLIDQSSLSGLIGNNRFLNAYLPFFAIGFRGGVNTLPVDDTIFYEALTWDESTALTDAQIMEIHLALGGTANRYGTKLIRRTNRRIFADYDNIT